jgi:hypothetical protein
MEDEFSQPIEWLIILSAENPLYTLNELKTVCSWSDCLDAIEIMDAMTTVRQQFEKDRKV